MDSERARRQGGRGGEQGGTRGEERKTQVERDRESHKEKGTETERARDAGFCVPPAADEGARTDGGALAATETAKQFQSSLSRA